MIPSLTSSSSQYAKIPSPSLPRPKTRTADLHRVWTELCMRENQARIRNHQLLQDFAALEAQLAALAAKTDALRRWKQDSEEFLQRLRRNLPRDQGPPRRQGLVLDKPPELLARSRSAERERQLPFEAGNQSEMLPFAPFDIPPTHVPATPPGKDPLEHLFHSPAAHRARKHGSPALCSLWFPQRLQKPWPLPRQERSHSASSQPWPVPSRTTMLRRGLPLPEEEPESLMAQVPESQAFGSPLASNTFQGKEAGRCSLRSRQGTAEEQNDRPVKREGHRLARGPAGQSCHLRLHGDAPSSTDVPESQFGLPRMCSGDDSSGTSVSCSAEVNSGHWVAERTTKVSPRQPKRKAKHQDADRMILNEEYAQISWERFSELLKHEEMAIIQGSGKALRQESPPCWEEQRDGELGEKGEIERGRTVGVGGEAMGSLDSGMEKTAEECGSLKEVGAQEDEGLRGRVGGLEQRQEDQGGNTMDEAGTSLDSGPEKTAGDCRLRREARAREDEGLRGRVGGLEPGQEDQGGNSMDEAGTSLDSGPEKTAEECGSLKEVGAREDEGLRGRVGGLEPGQEDQGGNSMDEAGTSLDSGTEKNAEGCGPLGEVQAEESNILGCFEQGQEVLEEDSVEGKEQASFASGSTGGESEGSKRHLEGIEGEGEKNDQGVESGSSEKDSQPDGNEGSQKDTSGDKEGDLEGAPGSQEGPSHPEEEEDAASTSTCSVEVAMGPKLCVTSERDNSGDSRTPSLQSESPLAASAESICEEEEEAEEVEDEDDEEEESEGDTDIEAALAPSSSKAETTRDQHTESVIPNFQEFQADLEEENEDRDLHDKDDFYD